MRKLILIILIIVSICAISLITMGPVWLVVKGFITFIDKSFIPGIIMIIVGLFLLWLIKPFSIITGKDLKIF